MQRFVERLHKSKKKRDKKCYNSPHRAKQLNVEFVTKNSFTMRFCFQNFFGLLGYKCFVFWKFSSLSIFCNQRFAVFFTIKFPSHQLPFLIERKAPAMREKETQKPKNMDQIICPSNNINILTELPLWVLYFFSILSRCLNDNKDSTDYLYLFTCLITINI